MHQDRQQNGFQSEKQRKSVEENWRKIGDQGRVGCLAPHPSTGSLPETIIQATIRLRHITSLRISTAEGTNQSRFL
jgi:hypothetical protein